MSKIRLRLRDVREILKELDNWQEVLSGSEDAEEDQERAQKVWELNKRLKAALTVALEEKAMSKASESMDIQKRSGKTPPKPKAPPPSPSSRRKYA